MTRTDQLRQNMLDTAHKTARIAVDPAWDTSDMDASLPERKACAIRNILLNMPLYIGPGELVVGTRTVYGHQNEGNDRSQMDMTAMPEYVSDEDIRYYRTNGKNYTKGHYTPGYERILDLGIRRLCDIVTNRRAVEKDKEKRAYLNSVLIAYEGLSGLIDRYSQYALDCSLKEQCPERKKELQEISRVCGKIATEKPGSYWEAVQLFWFSHLSVLIENFIFISYGRVDQFLYPFYQQDNTKAQQLTDCLLLKMYDGLDLVDERMGNYAGQHNITLGGVTRKGENAVNAVTYLFLDGLSRTRFPEPEVSVRIHSTNPPLFLETCSRLSVSGLNCIAYYHDDLFIKSMRKAGIREQDANDYSFDLCQDITLAGRADFFMSGSVDLAQALLKTMRRKAEYKTFDHFISQYCDVIAMEIRTAMTSYNQTEEAVRSFCSGKREDVFRKLETGELPGSVLSPLMSPLPLTSALYEGCIEQARDISWFGCTVEDRGFMVSNLVVAVNSIAALRKYVFDEKEYTLAQILQACDENYNGHEILRQKLWNAPKWGNDDDYADLPAKQVIEFACDEIMKYRTPTGARHLAGIHQPHPVFAGEVLQATPEGRFDGQPVPVTLSPENATMQNGPTAALLSAAKIDPMKYQWNNCVMLQYYSSVFKGNEGAHLFTQLISSYFRSGGTQHQPNIISLEELKSAQQNPERHRDLVVRLWGVSAHFVDLPRDVQNEFIARFENV